MSTWPAITEGVTVATKTFFESIFASTDKAVAEVEEQATELAAAMSAAEVARAELNARTTVLESRVNGNQGAKPVVKTLNTIGATHEPTSITAKAEVNPEGATTEYWFEFGTTEELGTSTSKASLEANAGNKAVEKAITSSAPGSLSVATFYRVAAQNVNGVTRGLIVQPVNTTKMKPTIGKAVTSVTAVTTAGATFNVVVNPNGETTTLTFELGTTEAYGTTHERTSKPTGSVALNIAEAFATTLVAGTTYHWRMKAVNGQGTTTSLDATFTVPAVTEALIGDETVYTVEAHTSKGRVETIPYAVLQSGTLTKLKFKTKEAATDEPTITSIRMAVIKDDGSGVEGAFGKPVSNAVLAEGSTTTGITEAEKLIEVTLSESLKVAVGEKLWIAVLPVAGGKIHFHASVASAGTKTYQSAFAEGGTHTLCNNVTTWESNGAQAPMMIYGTGTTEESTVPVLSVNGSDKQTVEWNSIGVETEYSVALSTEPSSVSGRATAYTNLAKIANPQKFKPEPNKTYGTGTTVTPAPGQTVYVGAKVSGSTSWSSEVTVKLPGESEPSTATKKGVDVGGWDAATELGDYEEAKLTAVRQSKPSAARVIELQGKSISVVYLYPGDTGGYNTGGVKAINRTAWVADAMKRIKEAKPKYFEALNEPAGDWFWGTGASSEANAAAYVELLKLLWGEVQKLPSEERPKILASFDGGHSGEKSWLENMKKANASFTNYFDYGTNHPYKKSGGNAVAKEGNRATVESCHSYSGKEICITEVGWPTISETSDSYKYTEAEQAEAVAGIMAWSKSRGWIPVCIIYGYRDGSGAKGYGLWHENDSPKPAVAKLAVA